MKAAALWAGLLALVAMPAWAGSIGLFATPDCTSCNLEVPLGTLGTFHVQAVPGWRLSGEDAKCYTFLCAGGGSLFVNSSTDCTVAAQPATWSRVRRLYR